MAVGSDPAACSHGQTGMESQNKATQIRNLMKKTCSVLAEWNPQPAPRDGRPTSAGSGGGEQWAVAIRCLLGITHRAFSSLCFQKQLFIWLAGLGLPRDMHFSRPKYLLFPFTSVVFGALALGNVGTLRDSASPWAGWGEHCWCCLWKSDLQISGLKGQETTVTIKSKSGTIIRNRTSPNRFLFMVAWLCSFLLKGSVQLWLQVLLCIDPNK